MCVLAALGGCALEEAVTHKRAGAKVNLEQNAPWEESTYRTLGQISPRLAACGTVRP